MPNDITMLEDLFDPEVVGDLINEKLVDAIKFSPLCRIDSTLQGRPGSTITLPSFAYIGDADVLPEGEDVPITKLTASTVQATIYKIAKAVQLTDESMLSGHGDPFGQAIMQIVLSIASKLDYDILDVLSTAKLTHKFSGSLPTPDDISDALIQFGEDIDGAKVYLCSPDAYALIRKSDGWIPGTEIGAQMIINGAVGMLHGCQVVITNKLSTPNTSFIVKPGALALYLKRDTVVETARDIINFSTVMSVSKHYVGYLYDASKAIKIEKE